jgi:hypothetical protein
MERVGQKSKMKLLLTLPFAWRNPAREGRKAKDSKDIH